MAKDYSPEILEAIEDFFERDNWKYDPINENGIIRTGVSLNGKCKSARVYINVRHDSFLVHSVPSFGADANCLHEIAEFITRANYGMSYGNFELDYSDGEVRFKTAVFCGDSVPTFDQVAQAIYVNCSTLDDYCDGMMKVSFGMMTPEEAIAEIEDK